MADGREEGEIGERGIGGENIDWRGGKMDGGFDGIFYVELLKEYSWCKWTRYLSSEFTYLQILEFRKNNKGTEF